MGCAHVAPSWGRAGEIPHGVRSTALQRVLPAHKDRAALRQGLNRLPIHPKTIAESAPGGKQYAHH